MPYLFYPTTNMFLIFRKYHDLFLSFSCFSLSPIRPQINRTNCGSRVSGIPQTITDAAGSLQGTLTRLQITVLVLLTLQFVFLFPFLLRLGITK